MKVPWGADGGWRNTWIPEADTPSLPVSFWCTQEEGRGEKRIVRWQWPTFDYFFTLTHFYGFFMRSSDPSHSFCVTYFNGIHSGKKKMARSLRKLWIWPDIKGIENNIIHSASHKVIICQHFLVYISSCLYSVPHLSVTNSVPVSLRQACGFYSRHAAPCRVFQPPSQVICSINWVLTFQVGVS